MSHTQTDGNGEVFLATTALEEFWDTTKPIVFLGEWYLLYSHRSFWEPLNGRLLNNPYDNADATENAYDLIGASLNTYSAIFKILFLPKSQFTTVRQNKA